jgi:hypothetical protein
MHCVVGRARIFVCIGVAADLSHTGDFLSNLKSIRATLDGLTKSLNHSVALSADEWGLGPPWVVAKFSVAHGQSSLGIVEWALSAVLRCCCLRRAEWYVQHLFC